jgi:hypothetical protein
MGNTLILLLGRVVQCPLLAGHRRGRARDDNISSRKLIVCGKGIWNQNGRRKGLGGKLLGLEALLVCDGTYARTADAWCVNWGSKRILSVVVVPVWIKGRLLNLLHVPRIAVVRHNCLVRWPFWGGRDREYLILAEDMGSHVLFEFVKLSLTSLGAMADMADTIQHCKVDPILHALVTDIPDGVPKGKVLRYNRV